MIKTIEINIRAVLFRLALLCKKMVVLEEIKITEKVNKKADLEAIRVVKAMPAWIPAEIDGVPVSCKYKMNISLKL